MSMMGMEQNPAQPVSYAPAQSQGYSTFEPPAPAQAPSAQPIPAPVATPAVGPYGQPPAASTPTPFAQPSPQPTQYPPQHPSQPAYGMPAYPSPMATSAQPPQAAAAPAPAPVPTPGAYQYPGYPAKETRAPSAHETPYGASVHTSAHPSMQAQPGVHAPQQMYAMNGYGVQPPANPHMLEKLMALPHQDQNVERIVGACTEYLSTQYKKMERSLGDTTQNVRMRVDVINDRLKAISAEEARLRDERAALQLEQTQLQSVLQSNETDRTAIQSQVNKIGAFITSMRPTILPATPAPDTQAQAQPQTYHSHRESKHDLRDDRGSSGRRESSSHREKPRNRSPSPSSSDQSDEDNSRRGHTRRRDSSRDRPHSRSPRPHSKFSRDNSSTKGHKRNDDDRYWDNQTKSRQEGRDRR